MAMTDEMPSHFINVRQIENGNWLWSAEVNGNFRVGVGATELKAWREARAYIAWAEKQEPLVWDA
jgi:hypothetical protein